MRNDIVFAIEQLLSQQKNQEKYLDSSDVCKLLGISKSTIYKMNHRRAIPYTKAEDGKKVYYLEDDVISYIKGIRFSSKQELDERAKGIINKNK